jgi:integrase
MKRARKEVGVRRKRDGYQVFARVNGTFRSVVMPLTSTPAERSIARERLIDQHGGSHEGAVRGSLRADVDRFLEKPEINGLDTVHSYRRYLDLWVTALGGNRPRHQITRDEIESVLQQWLKTCAPATVYHRRTPLGRLWTVLDGKDAPNPVHGTTVPDHYRPAEKSIPYDTVVAILAAMPTERAIRRGIRTPSMARLVAVTIAATGIPAAELLKLRRHDLDAKRRTIRMPWREKGAGAPAHLRELDEPGVAALAALFAAGIDGRVAFSSAAVTHSFKRAARRVCGPDTPVSLYWLRHTFGTDLYRLRGDLETVRRLLGHAEGSICTARYAMGAHAAVDRAALTDLSAYRAQQVAADPAADLKLPTKLPTPRNRQTPKRLERVS